ncbi:hypothetical protein PAXRUDRAFT_829953 [Paxillus rubicundulus Ve08.2h10]|uniref:Uncharacterized protein n=1 Tax=Paxillus rubicundulus Ve08.2h10 TaxID=930991 RepID=A0A0D0DZF8_9AGAM|nr:hypothetical protein PAXRUDRAFT_829953 [Paxillus rubicundulus Ve08.2h10]
MTWSMPHGLLVPSGAGNENTQSANPIKASHEQKMHISRGSVSVNSFVIPPTESVPRYL